MPVDGAATARRSHHPLSPLGSADSDAGSTAPAMSARHDTPRGHPSGEEGVDAPRLLFALAAGRVLPSTASGAECEEAAEDEEDEEQREADAESQDERRAVGPCIDGVGYVG